MMYSEFVDRTHKAVNCSEYHYIERFYMDSPWEKDEFCKRWLALDKSGIWPIILKLYEQVEKLQDSNNCLCSDYESLSKQYWSEFQYSTLLKNKIKKISEVINNG